MRYSPILLFHICAGTLGMLSGFVAVFLRKGSRRHGIAGEVFVIAMMILSATGAYMALVKSEPGNVLGGALTFYLVTTAWMTVARTDKDGKPGFFDWSALSVIAAVAAVELTYGIQAAMSPTGLKYDYPPGPYFFMGSVALFERYVREYEEGYEARVGHEIGGTTIEDERRLKDVVRDKSIIVGVIAVPAASAQQATDELVDAGVRIIFNYSEALLDVPHDVQVHTSNPAVELLHALYFHLA